MLVVSRGSARFLWFDEPRELLDAVLDCMAPEGSGGPARLRRATVVDGLGDEEDRLHSFLLLEGVVKEINRRQREYGFRVSWWGPLTDLQESRAPVPTIIRAWFRRSHSRQSSGTRRPGDDGAVPREWLPEFAEFLDRVTFSTDELGET